MIMGAGILIGLMFALANLIADLACLWLDPRQRQIAHHAATAS
jgi:ABC-type dipeptide/oligopeptide/nickel transport system permease component